MVIIAGECFAFNGGLGDVGQVGSVRQVGLISFIFALSKALVHLQSHSQCESSISSHSREGI